MKSTLSSIAKELEDKFLELDSNDPNITKLFANSIASFEKMAERLPEDDVDETDLVEIAAIAEAFDTTGDPELQKQASMLDELLVTIASPKNAIAKIKMVFDKELEQLRDKYREKQIDKKYHEPKKAIDKINRYDEAEKAVDKQVKRFRPLEAPLNTRYSPDYPGVPLVRITDRVYQDPVTGKVYDYDAGYTTNKGNEVPGGGIEHQLDVLDAYPSNSMFTTRDSILSSRAIESNNNIKKSSSGFSTSTGGVGRSYEYDGKRAFNKGSSVLVGEHLPLEEKVLSERPESKESYHHYVRR